jgi:hypothetical protein
MLFVFLLILAIVLIILARAGVNISTPAVLIPVIILSLAGGVLDAIRKDRIKGSKQSPRAKEKHENGFSVDEMTEYDMLLDDDDEI